MDEINLQPPVPKKNIYKRIGSAAGAGIGAGLETGVRSAGHAAGYLFRRPERALLLGGGIAAGAIGNQLSKELRKKLDPVDISDAQIVVPYKHTDRDMVYFRKQKTDAEFNYLAPTLLGGAIGAGTGALSAGEDATLEDRAKRALIGGVGGAGIGAAGRAVAGSLKKSNPIIEKAATRKAIPSATPGDIIDAPKVDVSELGNLGGTNPENLAKEVDYVPDMLGDKRFKSNAVVPSIQMAPAPVLGGNDAQVSGQLGKYQEMLQKGQIDQQMYDDYANSITDEMKRRKVMRQGNLSYSRKYVANFSYMNTIGYRK